MDKTAILNGLNEAQRNAVLCIDGPVLIIAGAGSGKTRVLTNRIANILLEGVEPDKVLALTFTKKAAAEMKERVGLIVGRRAASKLYMGTFHSVFIRILRDYADKLGYPKAFTIYDTGDSTSAIKNCIKELQLDEKVYKPKDVLSRISNAKNNLVTAEMYETNKAAIANDTKRKTPRIWEIYRLYAAKCRLAGVMDFDDVLLNMNLLLRDFPDALKEIAGRFSYIMVDEYQDTNLAQYIVLRRLAQFHGNICVVGDDSQSIYGFRGARIENILNFEKHYPSHKVFRLEQNYRSTQTIVDAANSLIEKNSNRLPKRCFSAGEKGQLIKLVEAYTEREEATLIADSILSSIRKHSSQYQDYAVLYRTNAQSRAIEEALRRRNIPYAIYSGNSFYERAEVKDVMAYFKLAVNINDDESFRRIVNKPARGIGDTSIAALDAAAHRKGCSLFKAIYEGAVEDFGLKAAAMTKLRAFADMISGLSVRAASEPAFDVANAIAEESGMKAFFKADKSVEGQSRLANVEELLNSVQIFVEDKGAEIAEDMQADGNDDITPEEASATLRLADYLENIMLLSAVDVRDEETANRVALMTVHTAKGLEFPYVYVTGMEENLFPSGGWLAAPDDVEEERRLFYVAMTRAKEELTLSFASNRMRNGKTENNAPSRFINEIDRQFIANPLDQDSFGGESEDKNRWRSSEDSWGSSPYWSSRSSSRQGSSSNQGSSSRQGSPSNQGFSSRQGTSSRPSSSQASYSSRPSSGQYPSSGKQYGGNLKPIGGKVGNYAGGGAGQTPSHTAKPQRTSDAEFIPTPILELRTGDRIEHIRFGYGVIAKMEGRGIDLKAAIDFDELGRKDIMLKYAKIRKVEE